MLKCSAESIFSLQEESVEKLSYFYLLFFFFLGIKSIIVTKPITPYLFSSLHCENDFLKSSIDLLSVNI